MIAAVIVAGGSGMRMQAAVRKQYLDLNGRPILTHTLMAFDHYPALDKIILVVPADDLSWCRRDIIAPLCIAHDIQLVAGGGRRQESVRNGLSALSQRNGIVMIHDGVRPIVKPWLIDACLEGVKTTGACIPATNVTDTLKRVDPNGMIIATLDRQQIRLAQTPQTFSIDLILSAHRMAEKHGFVATDDASVAEFAGERVVVVPGDRDNIKITTPQDLVLAKAIFDRWRQASRPV